MRAKKVLITAGPTREYWDPVRFLSNGSSGQMGIALAHQAARLGAKVVLVLGPIAGPAPKTSKNLLVKRVTTALEMNRAVQQQLKGTGFFVGAAAVSDFRPAVIARQKLKGKPKTSSIKLVRNPDIIAEAASHRSLRPCVVVGFALESQDVLKNAAFKLKKKRLDWIVANRVSNMGAASGSATLISRWGDRVQLKEASKTRLAQQIWGTIMKRGTTHE